MNKPEIYSYHDYRQYLKDRVEYEKSVQPRFSLRTLAGLVKVAPGFLPMLLSGSRSVTSEVLERIGTELGLNKEERKYLQDLRTIAESPSQALRLQALEGLQKSKSYGEKNPREVEMREYLTHWFNVTIREMVNLEDFQLDAKWIRSRMRVKVSLSEVEQAIKFLLDNGFIKKTANGKVVVAEKKLECTGSVLRLVFSQFHREMLSLASNALDTVPYEERSITGLTFPIPASKYKEIFKILDETLDRIDAISAESKGNDSVYHVGISLFPLTEKK